MAVYFLTTVGSPKGISKNVLRFIYLVLVVLFSIMSGAIFPLPLVSAFDAIGFPQDAGHGYIAFTLILNAALGILLASVGCIVIGQKSNGSRNT